MAAVPNHLSEANFRRFESVIASIVEHFPDAAVIDPKPLSPRTYAARLRDAMASYERFNWKSQTINRAKFLKIRPAVVVTTGDDRISVGGRTSRAVKNLLEVGEVKTPIQPLGPTLAFSNLTGTELHAVCLLVSGRRLAGPIRFTIKHPINKSELLTQYDIAITEDGNGYLLF